MQYFVGNRCPGGYKVSPFFSGKMLEEAVFTTLNVVGHRSWHCTWSERFL